jgi:hypothetical protein
MDWTEREKQGFREVFAVRRKRQLLVGLPILAIFVGVLFGWIDAATARAVGIPGGALEMGVAALILAAAGFSFYNWRCPSCNGYLGRELAPRFCARCGAPFD